MVQVCSAAPLTHAQAYYCPIQWLPDIPPHFPSCASCLQYQVGGQCAASTTTVERRKSCLRRLLFPPLLAVRISAPRTHMLLSGPRVTSADATAVALEAQASTTTATPTPCGHRCPMGPKPVTAMGWASWPSTISGAMMMMGHSRIHKAVRRQSRAPSVLDAAGPIPIASTTCGASPCGTQLQTAVHCSRLAQL